MKHLCTLLLIGGSFLLLTSSNALADSPLLDNTSSMDLSNPWLISDADPLQLAYSDQKNLAAIDQDTDLLVNPQLQDSLNEGPGAPEDALDDPDNGDDSNE